ncbi:MAG: hypothetical protein E6929_18470 [Clostridium sp.]|nr:hypothetical protein [Clostridium sp.]
MGYNQEVREVALALQEIKDKAPQKYEQIKKEVIIKYREMNLMDNFLKISKELDNWK